MTVKNTTNTEMVIWAYWRYFRVDVGVFAARVITLALGAGCLCFVARVEWSCLYKCDIMDSSQLVDLVIIQLKKASYEAFLC